MPFRLRKTLIAVAVSLLLGLGALIIFLLNRPSSSVFHIRNSDTNPVKVTAHWRERTHELGVIAPGGIADFTVKGEAGMSFDVVRANGTAVRTGETYFTPGVSIDVNIAHNSVNVTTAVDPTR